MTEYNILPKDLYNMDENDFAIGEIEATKYIINAKIRQRFQSKSDHQEWITVVKCICADGTAIPSLIIFKAKKVLMQWIPADICDD